MTKCPFKGPVRLQAFPGDDLHIRTTQGTVAILIFPKGWDDDARQYVCDAINEKITRDARTGEDSND